MSDTPRRWTQEDPWNFRRVGSFGLFSSADSTPIEFIQTTFTIEELGSISLAREIAPDELDFELLMQRDIDEERANGALRQYLNPDSHDTIFFPPLLLACVPTDKDVLEEDYPDEDWDSSKDGRLVRKWAGLLQMEFFTSDSDDSFYDLQCPSADFRQRIDLNSVRASFKLADKHGKGVKLITIDGQHRFFALSHMPELKRKAIRNLVVPTCILFSTSATSAARTYKSMSLPNVPKTFRKIFVDVNSKALPVGTHTNLLLNDTNIASLILRDFCSLVNSRLNKVGLSSVEWNIKSAKDARILTRRYSICSIGILERALEECFDDTKTKDFDLMSRLLNVEEAEIQENLKYAADNPENPDISWKSFSVSQRPIILEQARSGIVELLYRLFFQSKPYGTIYEHYKESLAELESKGEGNEDKASNHLMAFNTITNFGDPRLGDPDYSIISELGRKEKNWRDKNVSSIVGHALFQRAVILVLKEVLKSLDYLSIRNAGFGLCYILERAMDPQRKLLENGSSYLRESVWRVTGSIVNRDNTRKQIARLLLGTLGNREEANATASALELPEDKFDGAVERLMDLGQQQIQAYWRDYNKGMQTYFKRTYATSGSLSQKQIREFQDHELAQRKEKEDEKKGIIKSSDLKKPFDAAVSLHLADFIEETELELKDVLRLEGHVVSSDQDEEDEQEGEE